MARTLIYDSKWGTFIWGKDKWGSKYINFDKIFVKDKIQKMFIKSNINNIFIKEKIQKIFVKFKINNTFIKDKIQRSFRSK